MTVVMRSGMTVVMWSGMTAVMWLGMTAVMWLGMMIVLRTGAEITMHLSLGMMFLISEVLLVGKFRMRISLNKRCILLVQS